MSPVLTQERVDSAAGPRQGRSHEQRPQHYSVTNRYDRQNAPLPPPGYSPNVTPAGSWVEKRSTSADRFPRRSFGSFGGERTVGQRRNRHLGLIPSLVQRCVGAV